MSNQTNKRKSRKRKYGREKIKMEKIVTIIGRPNVGKSTLFNRLIGKSLSITDKEPGITRDVITNQCEWQGFNFTLVDTGGWDISTDEEITKIVNMKIKEEIEKADLILLVLDGQFPLGFLDDRIIQKLRYLKKKLLL